MAADDDDPIECSINEYLKIIEKCFRECTHSSKATDVTRKEALCVRYCIEGEVHQPKNTVANKLPMREKKSMCCVC